MYLLEKQVQISEGVGRVKNGVRRAVSLAVRQTVASEQKCCSRTRFESPDGSEFRSNSRSVFLQRVGNGGVP